MIAVVHIWFQPSWIVRTAGPIAGPHRPDAARSGQRRSGPALLRLLQHERSPRRNPLPRNASKWPCSAPWPGSPCSSAPSESLPSSRASSPSEPAKSASASLSAPPSARPCFTSPAPASAHPPLDSSSASILCAGALRILRSALFGVGVYDAPSILAAVLTLALVTVLATSIPVLRIASINPATTLRDE